MSAPFSLQNYQAWNENDVGMVRLSPTEEVFSSMRQDNTVSPVPETSLTSRSSPGSSTGLVDVRHPGQSLPGSQSMNSFSVQVGSCPRSASFDTSSNFHRVSSTLSSCSESHPMITPSTVLVPAPDTKPPPKSGNGSPTSRKGNAKPTVARRRSSSAKIRSKSGAGEVNEDSSTHRRQKRLQRNRESARLSRRRRKVYLEVLEERVNALSVELDQGRREHVANAIETIQKKRFSLLNKGNTNSPQTLKTLETILSRTSEEFMVCTTFQFEQLTSFYLPPGLKLIMWLTLQSDAYFRGGRAASERLSAARIGERMLTSGTERATAVQQMWPLLCNEIGLSYDQEEKVRNFQKTVLQDHESWVDRHRIFAAGKVMATAHDSVQALTLRAGQRERSTLSILSEEQRAKFLSWTSRNRARSALATTTKAGSVTPDDEFTISKEQHVAANLYILNHRLQKVIQKIPRAAPMLTGAALKKLSVRPSFESLGAHEEKDNEDAMSRELSFASAEELLARNESAMAVDDEDKVPSQITPHEAQEAAQRRIAEALGHVKSIMPTPPDFSSITQSDGVGQNKVPATTSSYAAQVQEQTVLPNLVSSGSMDHTLQASYPDLEQHHQRKSSFLPAHLNVVPEEMWPDDTEEFLMDLVQGDWAIGEGIDMDHIS